MNNHPTLELDLETTTPPRYAPDLVVIPCTAGKADTDTGPIAAADLYQSSTFTMGTAAATRIAGGTGVRIISALYGLIRPTRKMLTYDVTLNDVEACRPSELACDLELELDANAPRPAANGYRPDHEAAELIIVALVPNAYRELLQEAADLLDRPVVIINGYVGCKGIGDQRGRLGAIARGELTYLDLLALNAGLAR